VCVPTDVPINIFTLRVIKIGQLVDTILMPLFNYRTDRQTYETRQCASENKYVSNKWTHGALEKRSKKDWRSVLKRLVLHEWLQLSILPMRSLPKIKSTNESLFDVVCNQLRKYPFQVV
jgi:hypothetical protein